MAQSIQIKRRTTGVAGAPATLLAGELAWNSSGNVLYVGADGAGTVFTLVGAGRQVEVAGNQTIQGNKTWAAGAGQITIGSGDFKLGGGTANQYLRTDGAGNVSWQTVSLTFATDPEMDVATPSATTYVNPQNVRALVGGQLATLQTSAKTSLIAAINSLKLQLDNVAQSGVFAGQFDAAAGTITWTALSGQAGNTLPVAAPANKGWYIVCVNPGTVPPGGAPAGTYFKGDYLASDGNAWTHLLFGGQTSYTASEIAVNPAVNGFVDVQSVLANLDDDKLDLSGGTMTGVLVLSGAPTADLHASTKKYADDLAALRVAKTGDTMTGFLTLSAAPTTDLHAATKKYVDDSVAAGGGGGGLADGISIVGTGAVGDPFAVALVDCGTF